MSLEDLDRALSPGENPTPQAPKIPKPYQGFSRLFNPDKTSNLPPRRPGIDHEIHLTPEARLPNSPMYGMNRQKMEAMRDLIQDLLSRQHIRPSSSPAASPVFFDQKPNGKLRFCADYTALNDITIKNRYPLPLIRDTFHRLGNAHWFTKGDVISAFH